MARPGQKKAKQPPFQVLHAGAYEAARDLVARHGERGRAPERSTAAGRVSPLGVQSERDSQYGLSAGPPGSLPPPPTVAQPGGRLLLDVQSPAFKTLERLRRNLPEEGWFDDDLSPQRPFIWTILSYTVPQGMALWMNDYEFSIARQSGVDAGDVVYAEDGRFSGVMGFDVVINGAYRVNDLEYGLDPVAIPLNRSEYDAPGAATGPFDPDTLSPDVFNEAAANSFASPAGVGTSLLPVREQVQGTRGGPFTLVIGEGSTVALRGVVFRQVLTPIAFVEARLAGFQLHTTISEALIERMRPV